MQLCQLTLAVPGESLASIPTTLDSHPAANLLATWTSLWHPALVSHARCLPSAVSADVLADEHPGADELVLVPAIVHDSAREKLVSEDHSYAFFAREFASRSQVISHLAQKLEIDFEASSALAADFYALGFAYLQLELLTQHMSYEPEESKQRLTDAIVAAADAAVASDSEAMAEQISVAYDQLIQSRNHYYPIDFYLIDLSLTAPSTVGAAFAEECHHADKHNALVTGELLEHMSQHEPESLAALRAAVESDRMNVLCGTRTDNQLESLLPEQLLDELVSGRQAAEQHLGKVSTTFAHYSGPLSPILPSMLTRLGYGAAVLADFTGRAMPDSYSSRTTWTGLGSSSIDALSTTPLDMGSAATMFMLPSVMQDAMNYDLAAALLLVGWPGHRSEFYDDIKQIARRSSLLGRPITLDEYFEITESQDYSGTISAESYPGPASSYQTKEDTEAIEALAHIAGAKQANEERFAALLGATGEPVAGSLEVNASCGTANAGDNDTPAFGWRWTPNPEDEVLPPRCEPGILRNELMEVVFDPQTGGISATRQHETRGNFLSQQLVIAPLGPQGIAAGLQLAVDGWEVHESSDQIGTLASKFRVVDRDGKDQAEIVQQTSLAANSRSIDVNLSYNLLGSRPPSCIIASRIAVRQEDFGMTRNVGGVDLRTYRSQTTTEWLGVVTDKVPIAVICDQPRLHRRHSGRMLDTTLFKAAGENASSSLSYCLDSRFPAHTAAQRLGSNQRLIIASTEPTQRSGWWLYLGARNLLTTYLRSEIVEEQIVVRMRLLETAGQPVDTRLMSWRPIQHAHQTNFRGEADQLLKIDDGAVRLSLAAYEFAEIEFTLDSID